MTQLRRKQRKRRPRQKQVKMQLTRPQGKIKTRKSLILNKKTMKKKIEWKKVKTRRSMRQEQMTKKK